MASPLPSDLADLTVASYYGATALTSITPGTVGHEGGQPFYIIGEFQDVDCAVYISRNGVHLPCYSGVPGRGNVVKPLHPTVLRAVMPPLSPTTDATLFDVRVVQGGDDITLADVVTVDYKSWSEQTMALRRLLPPLWKTGYRTLETNPLVTHPSLSERSEIVLPVAPRIGFLASDMDGDDTFNTGWSDGYVFPVGSGNRWTVITSSTEPEAGLRQVHGANQVSATFRDDGSTPPYVDLAPGVNGVLQCLGTFAGALDWMVNDVEDCEVIVCVRPGAFDQIGGVITVTRTVGAPGTNQCSVMHDMRVASPNRMYTIMNPNGTNYSALPAQDTAPISNGVLCSSTQWVKNDAVKITGEDNITYASPSNAAAVPTTGSGYYTLGSAFIGYYKAGIHAVLLFDRVLTSQQRLDTFAQLRARFQDD